MADSSAAELCPVCQHAIRPGMPVTACPGCGTPHHYACWREHNGCAMPGCTGVPGAPPTAVPTPAKAPAPAATPPATPPTPTREAAKPALPKEPVPPSAPLSAEVEVLLAEMYLRLREGLHAEVRTRLDKAKQLAPPDHPALLEVEGDLSLALNRLKEAEDCYRRAFQADPQNALLEEKFAGVIMKMYEPTLLAHAQDVPDDEPIWSNRVARPVWASALLSACVPGFGQWHNGDSIKGAALLIVQLIVLSYTVYPVLQPLVRSYKETHQMFALTQVLAPLFSWPLLLGTLLMLGLWVYGIVDAVLVAREMQEEARMRTKLMG